MAENLLPIAIIVIGVGLFAIAIVYVILNWKKDQAEHNSDQQIAMLISRVSLMQLELNQKDEIIEEQKRRITFYTKQLEDVESRVRDLELILFGRNMKPQSDSNTNSGGTKPELLLIATDIFIQREDEIALNKSGIKYTRTIEADQNSIELELRRARQQKIPYRYVMFSGHATRQGWKLSDGTLLDSYWMNQNLSDVEILYLNGCETTAIADDLVNVVDCVISMSEKVPTKTAQSFAEMFWSAIAKGKTPSDAFTEAQLVEPSTKPYASIRF
jgi:hypothetical protein